MRASRFRRAECTGFPVVEDPWHLQQRRFAREREADRGERLVISCLGWWRRERLLDRPLVAPVAVAHVLYAVPVFLATALASSVWFSILPAVG